MKRENMKPQADRYYLVKKSRFARRFYQQSGTENVGTPEERTGVKWAFSRDEARSFKSPKEAERMSRLLWEKYGESTMIVDYYGEIV